MARCYGGKDTQRDKKMNRESGRGKSGGKNRDIFSNPAGWLLLVLHYNSTGVDDDKYRHFYREWTCWAFLTEMHASAFYSLNYFTCTCLQARDLILKTKIAVTLVKLHHSPRKWFSLALSLSHTHTHRNTHILTSTVVAALCVFLPIRSTCLHSGLMYFLATS